MKTNENKNNTVVSFSTRNRVSVDSLGRILIPAKLRDELGISKGDTIELSINQGKLTLIPTAQNVRLAQQLASKKLNKKKSLSKSLQGDRRKEAKRG